MANHTHNLAVHVNGRVTFDFARVTDMTQYGNLSTNAERVAFTFMTRDYMAWARRPTAYSQISRQTQLLARQAFAEKIRSPEAWPLIRQAAYEFMSPPDDFGALPRPLRHALDIAKAENLLSVSPWAATERQIAEEEWIWQKWETSIRYIAHLREIVDKKSRDETEASLTQLSDALSFE